MKDLIWDIAKSGEETLENTELQSIEEPKELFIARGVSLEAKDSTYKINKFCLLYTSPSPRDLAVSRMPSSA